MQTITFY